MRPSSLPNLRAKQPAILVTLLALTLAAVAFLAVPLAGALPPPSSPLTQTYSGTMLAKIGATNQVATSPNVITVTSIAALGSNGGYNGNITEVKIVPDGGPINGDVKLDTTTSGWTRQVGSTSRFTLNSPSDDAAMVYINGAWRQLKKTTGKPTVSANFTQSGQLVNLLISGQATNGKTVVAVEIKTGGAGLDSAPFVIEFDPADESSDVEESVTPTVLFNEPITADESAFSLICDEVSVAFTISGSGTALITLTPTAPLDAMATCVLSVDLSLVSDVDGFAPASGFGIQSVTFTVGGSTDSAPEVLLESSVPSVQNAVVGYMAQLHIVFSEDVSATGAFSVVCDSSPVAITATKDESDSYEIIPDGGTWGSEGASCTLTVDKDLVSDDDAIDPPDNMVADFVLTFTITVEDPPMVISLERLRPGICFAGGSGASCGNIDENNQPATFSADSNIQVNFTEAVDIDAGAFTLVCGANTISFTAVDSTAGAYSDVWSVVLDFDDTEIGSESGTCTFTVIATAVHDTDAIDPPDVMDTDKVITLSLPV